jgi:hypothetical protein
MHSSPSRRILAETVLAFTSCVTPAGKTSRRLLAFFDPVTAMLVFGYASLGFGLVLSAAGIYIVYKSKKADLAARKSIDSLRR